MQGPTPGAGTAGAHAKGLILGIIGVLLLSPDTLIIRLVDTNPWSFIAWRGAFMTIGMFVILTGRFGMTTLAHTYAIGWLGMVIALIFALNNVAFQLSVQSTTVANTLVIIATAPLFAALLSVVFLRERVPMRTWIAIVLSVLGVAMVFTGKLDAGDLFGNTMALVASIGLGLHFVLVRLARPIDMSPAIGVAGVMMCAIGLSMAPDLYLRPAQLGYLALLGLILLPASFIFLTRAPHYIPAPEVGLIILLETITGPLWVWLVIAEEPPLETLAGGGLIVLVLIVHSVLSLHDNRESRADASARVISNLAD